MFDKLVGNIRAKEYLETLITNNNVSHSYMFVGKSGIGKKQFAKEFAKAIMCINEEKNNKINTNNDENSINNSKNNTNEQNADKCKCSSCIKIEAGSNPDYTEIEPDGKTIKIEQIRKMQEKVTEKPIISNKKIYIINDSELMTEESQNCLLKTLEEPPKYAVIILIVANESKILLTIKSRCISIKFEDLTNEDIKKIYPELSNDLIELLEGSLEKANEIGEKKEQYEELEKIAQNIEKNKLVEIFTNSDLLYNNKDDIIGMLEYLNIIFYKKKIAKAVDIIEKTKRKIMQNNNYDMCIDYLLIHIWEEIHEKNSRG